MSTEDDDDRLVAEVLADLGASTPQPISADDFLRRQHARAEERRAADKAKSLSRSPRPPWQQPAQPSGTAESAPAATPGATTPPAPAKGAGERTAPLDASEWMQSRMRPRGRLARDFPHDAA